MVLGIVGGLCVSGLLIGAITGSIIFMMIPIAAGMLIAGIWDSIKKMQDRTAASQTLKRYPPYDY